MMIHKRRGGSCLELVLAAAWKAGAISPIKGAADGDTEEKIHFTREVTVTIYNSLGTSQQIKLYCKSEDDDLGQHVVSQGGAYQFSFHLNIWGKSHFWCALSVVGSDKAPFEFDVYEDRRDNGRNPRCYTVCDYRVQPSVILGFNQLDNVWNPMYHW